MQRRRIWTAAFVLSLSLFTSGCVHDWDDDSWLDIWVNIPAGDFMMGSPEDGPCRDDHEQLQRVIVADRFEIQATEVTQDQFERLMGYNPSHYPGCAQCPVESVTWDDPSVLLQCHIGEDLDRDPSNNFAGDNAFGIKQGSPRNSTLSGAISGGELTVGPGSLVFPVPIPSVDGKPQYVYATNAQMTAKITPEVIVEGTMTGLLSEAEVDNKILPALAEWSTAVIQGRVPNPLNELATNFVKGVVDQNGDGEITPKEWKDSLVGGAIRLDVDTDGDGAPDAISGGLGATFAPCVIDAGGVGGS